MEKVLLHSCCAPCSTAILEWMGQNGYEPTILFYNPNIFPEEEYLKRKNEIVRYAREIGVKIVDLDRSNTGNNAGGPWEQQHAHWLECTVGLENEPERGGRCLATASPSSPPPSPPPAGRTSGRSTRPASTPRSTAAGA